MIKDEKLILELNALKERMNEIEKELNVSSEQQSRKNHKGKRRISAARKCVDILLLVGAIGTCSYCWTHREKMETLANTTYEYASSMALDVEKTLSDMTERKKRTSPVPIIKSKRHSHSTAKPRPKPYIEMDGWIIPDNMNEKYNFRDLTEALVARIEAFNNRELRFIESHYDTHNFRGLCNFQYSLETSWDDSKTPFWEWYSKYIRNVYGCDSIEKFRILKTEHRSARKLIGKSKTFTRVYVEMIGSGTQSSGRTMCFDFAKDNGKWQFRKLQSDMGNVFSTDQVY